SQGAPLAITQTYKPLQFKSYDSVNTAAVWILRMDARMFSPQNSSYTASQNSHSLLPHSNQPKNLYDAENQTIHVYFGRLLPSESNTPWMLQRLMSLDVRTWLGSGGGLSALKNARVLELGLCEEFFFDTFPEDDEYDSARSAVQHHQEIPESPARLMATIRQAISALGGTLFDVVELIVQPLGEYSSMSDYFPEKLETGPGILRPTARVYREFIDEFTQFGPGVAKEVHLAGLFPDDWAALVEQRMRCPVRKDLTVFANEIGMLTNPKIDCIPVLDMYGPGGPSLSWERRLRNCHDQVTETMVRGAGCRRQNNAVEPDFDPGYIST
ncbi:hypothetical protein B0H63DRAFT_548823, partial [Podospora didyma]